MCHLWPEKNVSYHRFHVIYGYLSALQQAMLDLADFSDFSTPNLNKDQFNRRRTMRSARSQWHCEDFSSIFWKFFLALFLGRVTRLSPAPFRRTCLEFFFNSSLFRQRAEATSPPPLALLFLGGLADVPHFWVCFSRPRPPPWLLQ